MRQPKILTTLKTYTLQEFLSDLMAGATVALVALPLSIAIAIASGAEPAAGLITAIVAGFLISALGGSRVQIGGPTGAFIVVVYEVIAKHGYDGLVLATLMAGLLLLVAAYFRMGRLITYVPEAVVDGFTLGIAVIIATSQLKDFLGLTMESVPADFIAKLGALWDARASLNPWAVGVGLAALALILLLRRLAPRFPGVVVAMAVVAGAVAFMAIPVDTIASRFGDLPDALPMPRLPDASFSKIVEVLPSAFVIAFLAAVESLLSAMVADRMIGGSHRPNAEVLAQGAANIGSALFGGLPATGAIARTATNVRAGGKTPVAGMVHALAILGMMMLAAPYASLLAMPALAALLMLTAWSMSEPHKWRGYLNLRHEDRALLAVTMVLTVVADLTVAIGVGVAAGLAIRLKRRDAPLDWKPPER